MSAKDQHESESDMHGTMQVDSVSENERALWAARFALAGDVPATAFSFALLSISDSLQCLAEMPQTESSSNSETPQFLSACEGFVPQIIIDRTVAAIASGFITRAEAEDIACSFVLEERLRPKPWREQREPNRQEVERAVEVARALTERVRIHRYIST